MIRAAIIGCGQIGALYDTPESEAVLTHAHAITAHSACELVALCDANIDAAKHAAAIWQAEANCYTDVSAMLENEQLALVCIASPTALHAQHLNMALRHHITYIICEKPLAMQATQLEAMMQHYNASRQSHQTSEVLVNFIRAFDPSTNALAQRLHSGELGQITGFSAQCNKGVIHNGSHMMALLEQCIAPLQALHRIDAYEKDGDWYGHFYVELQSSSGLFSCYEEAASHFELQIMCEKGRVFYQQGGSQIILEQAVSSKQFNHVQQYAHYTQLPNTLQQYQRHVLEHLLQNNDSQFASHVRLSQTLLQAVEGFKKKGSLCKR